MISSHNSTPTENTFAARVEMFVARLFGRDVRELAAHRAVTGLLLLGALRDPEVGQLDLARARQQHVRRRHVAMDERHHLAVGSLRGVGVLECLADLGADMEREIERHPLAAHFEPGLDGAQIFPVDVLHHQEVLAVVAEPDIEDLHDVAMLEQAQHLRLGDQHSTNRWSCER